MRITRRLHQYRWLDRLLFKLGAKPRLTSTAAETASARRPDSPRLSLVGRTQEWLWREHSTSNALYVGTAIALAIFDFCLAASIIFPITKATSEDLAILNTLAQVAGGAFGTLITVVVFAIGLVSQRSDGNAMYTPFVARRYHVFAAAASAAAICLMNAVGPLMGQYFGQVVVKYLLLTNIVTMPTVTLVTVWLVCRVIESSGGTDSLSTLPVLRGAMARIAAHDRVLAATGQQFLAVLKDSPLKVNFFAGNSSQRKQLVGRFFGPGIEQLVMDADLLVLQELTDLAIQFNERVEFSLLAAPTVVGDKRGVLYVELRATSETSRFKLAGDAESDGTVKTQDSLEAACGEDVLARLEYLASHVFRYGKVPETDSDLRHFFARAQIDLERVARSGDSVTLRARMEDYRKLVGEWIAVAGPNTSSAKPRLFAYREPQFVGPLEIDLAEVLRAAVRSEDFETYGVAVDAVVALLHDADANDSIVLYADAASLLQFAFYLAMQNAEFRTRASDGFDRRVAMLLSVRKSFRKWYEAPAQVAEETEGHVETEMRCSITGSVLSMIRYAIESGESKTARMLIDRLTGQTEEETPRVPARGSVPNQQDGDSLILYGLVVIIGWCQHMVRKEHAHSATAREVIERVLASVPPRHALINMWELYYSGSGVRNAIEDQLHVSRWDLRDSERRVGFVYDGSGGNEWIKDGFWIAMLRSSEPRAHDLSEYRGIPPSRWLWRTEGLDQRLSELQAAMFSGESSDDQRIAREAVRQWVGKRQRASERAALQEIVSTPLSSKRKDMLRSEIVSGTSKHRKWHAILSGTHGLNRPTKVMPLPVKITCKVHREYLMDPNAWSGGYGDHIASNMVRIESQRLVYLLENSLSCEDVPFTLEKAGDAIRIAIQVLSARGYQADLVILPPQDRFACALFRCPLWEPKIGRRSEWGHASVGTWEKLTVVRCPYANITSVIVADTRVLMGNDGASASQPAIEITDTPETVKQEFLSKLIECGTDPLPDSNDLRVDTFVSLRPAIGIADLNAACRLDVTRGDSCFAMEPEDTLYHRVTCPDIEGAEHLIFSLSKRLDEDTKDRRSCQVCNPDRWDLEANVKRC